MDLNPPSWCPDAILTTLGWSHPQTGEVLVANRLLKPAYDRHASLPVIIPVPIEPLIDEAISTPVSIEPNSDKSHIEPNSIPNGLTTDKIVQAVSALVDDTKPRGRPKTKP